MMANYLATYLEINSMYPSDLSEKEWELIQHHFEPKDPRGRGHKHSKKAIVDAILYLVRGGIQWRMLPKDFPPWKTVYDHFSRWNKRGVWAIALDEINQLHRKKTVVNPDLAMGLSTHKALKLSMLAKNAGLMVTKK